MSIAYFDREIRKAKDISKIVTAFAKFGLKLTWRKIFSRSLETVSKE